MPRAVSESVRSQLWQRSEAGEPTPALAAALGLSVRTAQGLLASFRRAGGLQSPRYADCGRTLGSDRLPAHQSVLQFRRDNPGWGAVRIQLELKHTGIQPIPPSRTIRRWLAAAGLAPRPLARTPTVGRWAEATHEIWQMDAAEKIPLANGQRISWLRLADERSGAVLQTVVFPPGDLV